MISRNLLKIEKKPTFPYAISIPFDFKSCEIKLNMWEITCENKTKQYLLRIEGLQS